MSIYTKDASGLNAIVNDQLGTFTFEPFLDENDGPIRKDVNRYGMRMGGQDKGNDGGCRETDSRDHCVKRRPDSCFGFRPSIHSA